MYLPYLRGRQYDLLALCELSEHTDVYDGEDVLPIIEPVTIGRSVNKSYRQLAKDNVPFILITNPQHGDATETQVKDQLVNGLLATHEDYYLGYLITQRTTLAAIQRFVQRYEGYHVSFIHYNIPQDEADVIRYINGLTNVSHNVFHTAKLSTRYVQGINSRNAKRIILKDGFNKAAKNADYAATPREHFHDLHTTYTGLGYHGFSDFLIMGEKYEDGGGPARAVAIHLTHRDGGAVYAQHFVSDEVGTLGNVAGKFGEAVEKADNFIDATPGFIATVGSNTFQNHNADGTFPGLPTVKKIAIMHHIEMMHSLV